jgi:uncharacterized protein YjbI with pentapeptide repeats
MFVSGRATWVWAKYSADRENITPIATFVGAAIAAYAVLRQAAIASRRHYAQTEADRQRRIVESFSKAVEQLGGDKLEVRVGAIFALERLSKESPDDYWTIMEVLTAFVRERRKYTTITARLSERAYFLWLQAGQPEGRSEEFWVGAVQLERLEDMPTDIAAILTVIKRRSIENRQREDDREWFFNLSGIDLRDLGGFYLQRAFLNGAHLEEAFLKGVHLEGASLIGAQLEGATLHRAHLEGAHLIGADLREAYLRGAHLERADLSEAHLERADLRTAHFEGAMLDRAHLERADLRTAHLEEAALWEAHLEGANLSDAHIERANLRAAHLERTNLRAAHLEGAVLWQAHLEGADLRAAHLEGAVLVSAHLEGAILVDAVGLTDDQLLEAFGDEKTQLPEGVTRPSSWQPFADVSRSAVKAET